MKQRTPREWAIPDLRGYVAVRRNAYLDMPAAVSKAKPFRQRKPTVFEAAKRSATERAKRMKVSVAPVKILDDFC